MEVISLNPVEQKRQPHVRPLIIARDKYATFPLLENGKLEGMNYFGDAKYGQCHHITPFSFLVVHRPHVDPNHPLNLITIDCGSHNVLHREWAKKYGCNPELIRHEVLHGGKAGWVDMYDDALTSIALIRSYQYMQVNDNFFPEYQEEIASHYDVLDQDFIDRYNWFTYPHT